MCSFLLLEKPSFQSSSRMRGSFNNTAGTQLCYLSFVHILCLLFQNTFLYCPRAGQAFLLKAKACLRLDQRKENLWREMKLEVRSVALTILRSIISPQTPSLHCTELMLDVIAPTLLALETLLSSHPRDRERQSSS